MWNEEGGRKLIEGMRRGDCAKYTSTPPVHFPEARVNGTDECRQTSGALCCVRAIEGVLLR